MIPWSSSPQPLQHQGPVLWKTVLPRTGAGGGFGMIQAHYIYCALYYYYIVIYNEIIIQLTMMPNQWDPWACFPTTRWSHRGVMGDSDTRSVWLMSSLLRKMQLVTCHSLIGFWYEPASNWFITVSVQSNLSADDNRICSRYLALASPPPLHLRSSGIRFSWGAHNLDPSHVQFTVGSYENLMPLLIWQEVELRW